MKKNNNFTPVKTLEILVTTMDKNKKDILALLESLNVESDVVVANQCNTDETYTLKFNGFNVNVISTTTRGVSKNRNILLNNFTANVGVCFDDDCTLLSGYTNRVLQCINKYQCDAIIFNGFTDFTKTTVVKEITTKKAKKYFDISFAGAPGLAIRKEAIKIKKLSFNEMVGTPNLIFAGEDSLFIFDLFKSKCKVYREQDPLYFIKVSTNESSTYFKGYNEQFFMTKGAILKLTHSKSYLLLVPYYLMRYHLLTKCKIIDIYKYIRLGFKFIKNGNIYYE
jgi:hypothetical protein